MSQETKIANHVYWSFSPGKFCKRIVNFSSLSNYFPIQQNMVVHSASLALMIQSKNASNLN